MANQSILQDKDQVPSEKTIAAALGAMFPAWQEVADYAQSSVPGARSEWNYSKLGWNFRIHGRKAVVIYMMPCEGYFITSFVLGKVATEQVLSSGISEAIKEVIHNAKVHAEGRGFRITIANADMIADVHTITDIKLSVPR